MSWAVFHAESEQLAINAYLKLRTQNLDEATLLYRQAAEAEEKALGCLDLSKIRTRGITAVSIVALWFKAKQYTQAERVAHRMLADENIPDFAREDLRNLVQAIWTEGAKQKAGVAFVPGQVLVSVKGGDVVTGGAPLDLIVQKVQTIQAMFYRTIEYLNGVSHRRSGPPSKELQEACRPWLFQSAPGSYQFSVAIQKPRQPDFFKEDVEPERIAQHFLDIVQASSGEDVRALEALVSDGAYQTTFLKLARNLAPAGDTFERIELRKSGDSLPVGLSLDSRTNINNQLRQKNENILNDSNEEVLRGTLRAVHLDKDWLEIAVGGEHLHIGGLQDAIDDVIGPLVNRSVSVRVIRLSSKKLKFVDIELIE